MARSVGRTPDCGRGGFTFEHSTGSKPGSEFGALGIIDILRFLFGIQVIEVSEKLIESVYRGQEFVAIPKMVLAVLKGHVAEGLEQFRNGGILLLQSDW